MSLETRVGALATAVGTEIAFLRDSGIGGGAIKLDLDGVPYFVAGDTTTPVTPDPDPFTMGVTRPTTANTGTTSTPRSNYSGSLVGSSDPTKPTLLRNLDFGSLVTPTSGYFDYYNCAFKGGPGTFNTGQVDMRASGHLGSKFERCTFSPVSRSYWLNNIIGHHFDVYRCLFENGVDAVGSYNQYGRRTDNKVRGSYFGPLTRYDVDADHSDGSHNDTGQHQGGEGFWWEGNDMNGYAFLENGAVPASPFHRASQGVIVQQNVAVGGVYYLDDIHINRNWVRGYMHPFTFKSRVSGGHAYDVEIKNNRWMNSDQRDGYGTPRFYNLRLDALVTANGISYPTSGSTADTNGNSYDTGTDVASEFRGLPILVRRDNITTG